MKKLLLIFLAAVLMLPLYTQSAAANSIIDQIDHEMVETYGPGFEDEFPEFVDINGNGVKDADEGINQDLFNDRKIIVYGKPFEFDEATEHNRYLGYTYLGEKYTNTLFRHDAFAGGRFHERNWFNRPEVQPAVLRKVGQLEHCEFTEAIRENPHLRERVSLAATLGMLETSHFEEAETFKDIPHGDDSIIAEIERMISNGNVNAAMDILRDRAWVTNLADRIYILSPPTEELWGMGRMWHQADGKIWYYTIPLAPLKHADQLIPLLTPIWRSVDFTAEIEPGGFYNVLPGTEVSGTATFRLTAETPAEAMITLHHQIGDNKWSIHTETREFGPGEVLNIPFNATASTVDSHIVAEIQPVEMTDPTPDNNIARATIFVEPPVEITYPPEADGTLILTTEPRVSERTGHPLGTREPSRPGWTNARWTDRITAKIEPEEPDPPEISGERVRDVRITNWWISSATLYRPKTHRDATYGHYPDWMQRVTMDREESIQMPTGGRTSEVTFTQNWSIAGAKMRDIVTGRMVAPAAEYPVRVTYTITYEYEYEIGIRVHDEPPPGDTGSGQQTRIVWEIRTGTEMITGEASGLVYVDGVGTVIIAN